VVPLILKFIPLLEVHVQIGDVKKNYLILVLVEIENLILGIVPLQL